MHLYEERSWEGTHVAEQGLQAASPVIRLHPNDDVVIARAAAGRRCASCRREDRRLRPDSAGAQGGHARDRRRASRCAATTRSSASPRRTSSRASTCTRTTWRWPSSRATMPSAPTRSPPTTSPQPATFMGIVRPDGRVATRNYIGILTSVNCSATVARAIADHFRRDIHPEALADYPNVDGVVALTHGTGCAVDPDGEGLVGPAPHARRLCLPSQFRLGADDRPGLRDQPDRRHPAGARPRASTTTCARSPSRTPAAHAKTIARGIELIKEMLPHANEVTREPVPASHLIVGLQCGGSDGYSGITRQPGAGRRGGPAGAPRRHRHPVGDAGDLRRRAPADAPRRVARSRREAGRAHPLVGGVLRAQQRGAQQQPVGRQQGRRPDDGAGEVAGRRRPRPAPPTWSRSTSMPSR